MDELKIDPPWTGLEGDLASARADNLSVATEVAEQVLCLPISPDLSATVTSTIADLIRAS